MAIQRTAEEMVRTLCETQRFAVLATVRDDRPHTSLMAFAAMPDLQTIIIATDRGTRKYGYMAVNAHVSMLIDNCTNRSEDVTQGITITVTGLAEEITGQLREQSAEYFLARHPYMAEFIHSASCALIQVHVTTYQVVSEFQNVREWRPLSKSTRREVTR